MQLNNINTVFLGKTNYYYSSIDSTQSEIWRLYEKGTPNGTLVMSEIQTNGKGTHGRNWHTDEANNIAFSFLIEANCNIEKLEGLTTKIAKIILKLFKESYNISLNIKYPNDIVYNGHKIGGILTETKVTCKKVKALVIGIGINTNQVVFNKEIENIATSIKKEFNIEINSKEFIKKFCEEFEKEIIERIEKQ